MLHALAFVAIMTACTFMFFWWFWRWYDFFRQHRALTYLLILLTALGFGVPLYAWRSRVLAGRLDLPTWVQALGWILIAMWTVIATVADRQLGLHVRSFGPHFEPRGRIKLLTTGAYGIVRHPLYAAGSFFILGTFLATGYPAVLAAWVLFTGCALWFTRREEERTMALLDDPSEYERYRARVPALFPFLRF